MSMSPTMNPSMNLGRVLAPLHLLAFSALLGTQLYQTFIVVKVTFSALPRSAFTTLQKRLFPIYFRTQSLLLFMAAMTVPARGPLTLSANKAVWVPFTVAGVTAALNLMVYGPRTRQLMTDRIHQRTRDALKQQEESMDDGEAGPQAAAAAVVISPEMQQLHRSFARMHAISIHLNLLTVGATLWWGWTLASHLNRELGVGGVQGSVVG
ncbi:hypothetical protein F5Y17DRAFT_443875 [Xylariaceae sp. FL0594]|nr:hypothetical protein F5Y17DRAFT_443875 [Xylariaceae sp. FL0594]